MKTLFLCCLAAAFAASITRAHAQTFIPALQFTDSFPDPTYTASTRGYSFDVTANSGLRVTGLSIYDADGDGLIESHEVGLWNSAGTLLASATIPAGTTAELDDASFRYVTLPLPILLPAGSDYAVGAFFLSHPNESDGDTQAYNLQDLATADGLNYDQSRVTRDGSTTLTFPTSTFGDTGLIGGSFEVGVPEPSTWALLGIGVAGTCLLTLRHRRVGV